MARERATDALIRILRSLNVLAVKDSAHKKERETIFHALTSLQNRLFVTHGGGGRYRGRGGPNASKYGIPGRVRRERARAQHRAMNGVTTDRSSGQQARRVLRMRAAREEIVEFYVGLLGETLALPPGENAIPYSLVANLDLAWCRPFRDAEFRHETSHYLVDRDDLVRAIEGAIRQRNGEKVLRIVRASCAREAA